MKKTTLSLCVCFLSSGFVACQAKQAIAPRENIQVQALKAFPKQDMTFFSNQVFLWPEDATADQMSEIFSLSNNIEKLEEDITPIKNRIAKIQTRINEIEGAIRDKEVEKNGKANRLRRKKDELRKKIEAAQKIQNKITEGHVSAEELRGLQDQLKTCEAEQATLQNDVKDLESAQVSLNQEIETLKASSEIKERDSLKPQIDDNESRKRECLGQVTKIVTWYDPQPSTVALHFDENGKPSVSIRGWGLDPQSTALSNFSSQPAEDGLKPNIVDVKYQEVGGILDFVVQVFADEAQTRVAETYAFHLARNKYDSNDGKIYFVGNVVRTRGDGDNAETRRGVVKLVDKNN